MKPIKATAIAVTLLPLYGCASLPSFSDLFHPEPTTPVASSTAVPAPKLNATEPQDFESTLLEAAGARKGGDLTYAARLLSQLMLVSPDDPRVLSEYGKTLAVQGRSDDAIAFLERATQLSPPDWTLYSALGVAYDQKGNYIAAQGLYDRALRLRPGEPSVLNNAALSHMQAGDLDGAEKLLRQIAEDSPDYDRVAQNLDLLEMLKAEQADRPAAAQTPSPTAAAESPKPAAASAPFVASAQPVSPPPSVAADTPVAVPAPAPVVVAEEAPPAEPKQLVTPALRQSLPPAPESWVNEGTPLEVLKADPTVRMQALPKDDVTAAHQDAPAKPALPKVAAVAAPVSKPASSPSEATTAPVKPAVPKVAAKVALVSKPVSSPSEATPAAEKSAEQTHTAIAGIYYVQAGAFKTADRAGMAVVGLEQFGAHVMPATVQGQSVFRVRIGPFRSASQAQAAIEQVQALGRKDVMIVKEFQGA